MALSEAVLARNLEEIQSELELLRNGGERHLASSIRSKISFLKSLLAAEFSGRTPDRLNHFVSQLSALESALDEVGEEEEAAEQPKKSMAMEGTGYVSVRRNLEELEAMVHIMALEPPTRFLEPK
ncbi:hypothetical protein HPP92_005326 [Vanilla planifolia]|uniref:DUF7610 domain-containing protein n=1 Tax=Vanilla planifolia TaxID=51239 RepID=A0A835RTM9_VANPL|nr:hypothetical protein HPP92_005326 [Vanilla planifolia]